MKAAPGTVGTMKPRDSALLPRRVPVTVQVTTRSNPGATPAGQAEDEGPVAG
jgi:hypothetical protein